MPPPRSQRAYTEIQKYRNTEIPVNAACKLFATHESDENNSSQNITGIKKPAFAGFFIGCETETYSASTAVSTARAGRSTSST